MDPAVQLLIAAVVATAEFCAAPIEGGVGEPQFCRIYAGQEVSTPFFSIVVEPDFLVGVHQQGRRLQVQSSLSQSQNHLSVEVIEGSALPSWPDCPGITETVDDNLTWQDCQKPLDRGGFERRLAAKLKGSYVLIQYSYSAIGATSAPALERMRQSVRIHAI